MSGGLHENHAITTWEPSQHFLEDRGKPSKTCVEICRSQDFSFIFTFHLTLVQADGLILWNPRVQDTTVSASPLL
jgi:hypothetical protein